MAEHWLYVPSIGLFIFFAKVIDVGMKKAKVPVLLTVIGVILFYAYETIRQNTFWKDPIHF